MLDMVNKRFFGTSLFWGFYVWLIIFFYFFVRWGDIEGYGCYFVYFFFLEKRFLYISYIVYNW